MRRFIVNIVFMALMFGIFVGWPFLYDEGVINIGGIIVILIATVVWGMLFLAVYMTITKLAKRHSDKLDIDDEILDDEV